MHGKIYFPDLETLNDWLVLFGKGKCTAVFEATPDPVRSGGWVVSFSGGY